MSDKAEELKKLIDEFGKVQFKLGEISIESESERILYTILRKDSNELKLEIFTLIDNMDNNNEPSN